MKSNQAMNDSNNNLKSESVSTIIRELSEGSQLTVAINQFLNTELSKSGQTDGKSKPCVVVALTKIIANSNDSITRDGAANAAVNLINSRQLPFKKMMELVNALNSRIVEGEYKMTTSWAAFALVRLRLQSPAFIEMLSDLVFKSVDFRIRSSAIETLSELQNDSKDIIDLIIDRALNDKMDLVRTVAVNALARVQVVDLQIIRALIKVAASDDNEWTKASALQVLGETATRNDQVKDLFA